MQFCHVQVSVQEVERRMELGVVFTWLEYREACSHESGMSKEKAVWHLCSHGCRGLGGGGLEDQIGFPKDDFKQRENRVKWEELCPPVARRGMDIIVLNTD